MKRIACVLISLLFLLSCSQQKTLQIIACGDDKVIIIDEQTSEDENVKINWSWSVSKATDLPEKYQKLLIPFDECKPVDKGKKLLLTSSGGGVVLLDIATKKSLFYAYAPMAHSAELLPDNRIAVALSTNPAGNSLELYDVSKPEVVLFKDTLYSGHGSVWMPKQKRLYALGYDDLRAYSLTDWDTETPSLTLEKTWILPAKGGHDLIDISNYELIVTAHEAAWVFDIEKEEFKPFEPLANEHHVKSVNYDKKTGRLIYTKAETSWWTHNIYMRNPDKTITIPDIKLYKVRPM